MPLIDITTKRDYRLDLQEAEGLDLALSSDLTHTWIKVHFANDLPLLLVDHAVELGLDPSTPPEGIQIIQHSYGEFDVNAANVWIKIQFSKERPDLNERLRIRDLFYEIIIEWFHEQGFEPEDIVMDLFWGPTNGCGSVNGVEIKW